MINREDSESAKNLQRLSICLALAAAMGSVVSIHSQNTPQVPLNPRQIATTLVVPETKVERFRSPAIDAHSHAYANTPEAIAEWVRAQETVGVRQVFVLTGASGEAFKKVKARYVDAYPGRFIMFAGFEKEGIEAPDYGERLRRSVRDDFAAGAAGLGELSDKGLGFVRVGDKPYFIDDARFDPMWDEAANLQIPVFVHIAEPSPFYDPVDEKNELRRSAKWSLHGKGTPGFAAMIEKFERVLARHPRTQFVAVHAFNWGNNLGAVAGLLERYPNVQVDFSARMWELGRQPFTARKFFEKFADRILFGTDNGPSARMYLAHVRQFETLDEWFFPADTEWWRCYGMGLPETVLKKIYSENAERLLARSSGAKR